jgi:hypothetical protein
MKPGRSTACQTRAPRTVRFGHPCCTSRRDGYAFTAPVVGGGLSIDLLGRRGGGSATAGTGPAGTGKATPGRFGLFLFFRSSLGGGIAIFGTATGDNVSISGNHAMAAPDIFGTLLP